MHVGACSASNHATFVGLQVLTIHSPFRIENHTSASLEFEVHLFSAPHLRGASPTSTIPSAGPLLPNLQCYLPTPAIWSASRAPMPPKP